MKALRRQAGGPFIFSWRMAAPNPMRPPPRYPTVFTLRLGAWPGRFRCGSGKTQSHCVGLGLFPSLRSKLPYAPAAAPSKCAAFSALRSATPSMGANMTATTPLNAEEGSLPSVASQAASGDSPLTSSPL